MCLDTTAKSKKILNPALPAPLLNLASKLGTVTVTTTIIMGMKGMSTGTRTGWYKPHQSFDEKKRSGWEKKKHSTLRRCRYNLIYLCSYTHTHTWTTTVLCFVSNVQKCNKRGNISTRSYVLFFNQLMKNIQTKTLWSNSSTEHSQHMLCLQNTVNALGCISMHEWWWITNPA